MPGGTCLSILDPMFTSVLADLVQPPNREVSLSVEARGQDIRDLQSAPACCCQWSRYTGKPRSSEASPPSLVWMQPGQRKKNIPELKLFPRASLKYLIVCEVLEKSSAPSTHLTECQTSFLKTKNFKIRQHNTFMVPHSGTTANLQSWVSLAAFGYMGRGKVPTTAGSPQDLVPNQRQGTKKRT